MSIAVTANNLQHWPSPTSFSQHTRSAAVQQICRTSITPVERVIIFSIFDLGFLPLGQSSPKGDMTYYPTRSTILQNFSQIEQTVYEICVTNFFSNFVLGDTPLGQNSPKGKMAWWSSRSTTLQNFTALRKPTLEISVTKILRTDRQKNKQTKNKYASCPDWRISPHADRRHHSCKRYVWQCIFKYKIKKYSVHIHF